MKNERVVVGVLNTSILTSDGLYEMKTISLEQAKIILTKCDEIDSAIGHNDTAEILTKLLGINIPMNRQFFVQKLGQACIVFKLKGRPPEGAILSKDEIEEIGYEFKLLVKVGSYPKSGEYIW